MKLLDRYILKQFLITFIFTEFVIVLVILIIDITEKTEKFVQANLTFNQIVSFYMDFIPWISNLITPLIIFIAAVFITSKLAGQTEIIAMLSSGISFKRIFVPYFIGSVLVAVLSFVLTGWVIPNATKSRKAFEIEYLNKSYYFNKSDVHMQVAPNTYLYIRNFNNKINIGYNFTLERVDSTKLLEKLSSERISWNEKKNKWTLSYWKKVKIEGLEEVEEKGATMDTSLVIHPDEFKVIDNNFEAMTLSELDKEIEKLSFRGSSNVEFYLVEKYTRYMSPFAIIILTFLGVLVSSRKTRGGTGYLIALGFSLSFLYIIFFMMSKSIAETGQLPPQLSVWIPNIVFGGISLLIYKYIPR